MKGSAVLPLLFLLSCVVQATDEERAFNNLKTSLAALHISHQQHDAEQPWLDREDEERAFNNLKTSLAALHISHQQHDAEQPWLDRESALLGRLREATVVYSDPTEFSNTWGNIVGVPAERRKEVLLATRPLIEERLGADAPHLDSNIARDVYLILLAAEKFNMLTRLPDNSLNDMNRWNHDLIIEMGGGGAWMARTLIHHFTTHSRVKYVIYDLPVMSALQSYSLTSVGIHATRSMEEWVNYNDGASVLLVTDLGVLQQALLLWEEVIKTAASTAAFASFWAISESPIDLRLAVLNTVAPQVDDVYITYQREFEQKDNRRFFSLEMVDLFEDRHNVHADRPFTWLNGRMEFGIQHNVDGDMFILGHKRPAQSVESVNKYAVFVSHCNVSGDSNVLWDIAVYCEREFTPKWGEEEGGEVAACKKQVLALRGQYCEQPRVVGGVDEPFRMKLWKRDIGDLERAWAAATNIKNKDDDEGLCFLT